MAWWKRKKAQPEAGDLRRRIQESRVRLAQVEADLRRQAAEQELDRPDGGERPRT